MDGKRWTRYPSRCRALKRKTHLVLIGVMGSLLTAPAFSDYEPQAPYVPTVEDDVELMLDLAAVGPGDYLIDLGSGDGRIVIAAAQRGAYGHGVEIESDLVVEARHHAIEAGVSERVAFVEGDLFDADIAGASVVALYLFPEVNLALRPKLLSELTPGTRVVSNSFDMGDWQPDVHDFSARSSGGVLLWVVPAPIAGDWVLEIEDDSNRAAYALRIAQRYQEIDIRVDGRAADDAGRFAREQFAVAHDSESPAWQGEAAARYGGDSPARQAEPVVRYSGDSSARQGEAAKQYSGDSSATQDRGLRQQRPLQKSLQVSEERLHGDRLSFRAEADGHTYAFSGRIDGDRISGYVHVRDAAGERLRHWHASR